jgi:beta-glucosidase
MKTGVYLCALLLALSTSAAAQTSADVPYKNPSLPVEQRVNDLVSRMTLREKLSQLGHPAAGVPRLGVPAYNWWSEGLHGVARAGHATVFPQAIGLAATFDEPLMHQVADVISTEFRAKYYASLHKDGSSDWYRGLTVWSPNINIFRDPRWGRGQETYGEDPYLTSRLGVAFVKGLQGDDPKYFKTIATSKHFAVHSGPESTRHTVDVTASRHDVVDTYLPAFRATLIEGRAASVMCAYNSLNGEPACANNSLLVDSLRKNWNFTGYVVSDCGAIDDVADGHHFSKSYPEAVQASLKAGTDLICGWPPERFSSGNDALVKATQSGLISEANIDQAVRRLFTARFRLGLFDPAAIVPYASIPPSANDSDAHRQLALKTARESLVLLKNDNHFLPLTKKYGTIAVIGPNADSYEALVGNYNGTPSSYSTILSGISKRFKDSKVVHAEGTGLIGPSMEVIPSSALWSDDPRKQNGLKAEYFAAPKVGGTPALTRVDPKLDFVWEDVAAALQLPKQFSARWSGSLVPPATGDYLIGFSGQGKYSISLDGKPLIEPSTVWDAVLPKTRLVHLEQNHAYPVVVEYSAAGSTNAAHLLWSKPGQDGQDAIAVAKNADLVVLVMGLAATIEGEEMDVHIDGFAGGDRTKIDLPRVQEDLIKRIHALGKPVVLVLMNGSALAVNWADQNLPAILEAWYPGEEGGTAVAEALAGDVSPAGRLPITFYKSVDQLPAFDDYSMAKRTYRYFDGEPLYPFGYGLSYTSFAYDNARVERAELPAAEPQSVSVEVSNTGSIASDEVVQVYLSHEGVAGAPLRALVAFQRVHLLPGQKKTVTFKLNDRDLSTVDQQGTRRIVPGDVEVWIGGGQPTTRSGLPQTAGAKTQFKINGTQTLAD